MNEPRGRAYVTSKKGLLLIHRETNKIRFAAFGIHEQTDRSYMLASPRDSKLDFLRKSECKARVRCVLSKLSRSILFSCGGITDIRFAGRCFLVLWLLLFLTVISSARAKEGENGKGRIRKEQSFKKMILGWYWLGLVTARKTLPYWLQRSGSAPQRSGSAPQRHAVGPGCGRGPGCGLS